VVEEPLAVGRGELSGVGVGAEAPDQVVGGGRVIGLRTGLVLGLLLLGMEREELADGHLLRPLGDEPDRSKLRGQVVGNGDGPGGRLKIDRHARRESADHELDSELDPRCRLLGRHPEVERLSLTVGRALEQGSDVPSVVGADARHNTTAIAQR